MLIQFGIFSCKYFFLSNSKFQINNMNLFKKITSFNALAFINLKKKTLFSTFRMIHFYLFRTFFKINYLFIYLN